MLETIRRIIVPTDFSDLSDIAMRSAVALGRRDSASIHLLHVIRLPFLHTNYDVNVPEAIWEGIRKGTQERMDAARKQLLDGRCGSHALNRRRNRSIRRAVRDDIFVIGRCG